MLHVSDRRTHVRCKKYRARRVLAKAPNRYLMPPVCRTAGCGSRDYTVDKWMENRPTGPYGKGAMGCMCGGYHFTHRRGSPWCHHNPLSPLYHADRQGDPPESLLRIAGQIRQQSPKLADQIKELCDRWSLEEAEHG